MGLEATWSMFFGGCFQHAVQSSSIGYFTSSQGRSKADGDLSLPTCLFFSLQRGQNHQGNGALLGPLFKDRPHSEIGAQRIIGKRCRFYRSIFVLYLFPTNYFMFSSLFILKQIHTR